MLSLCSPCTSQVQAVPKLLPGACQTVLVGSLLSFAVPTLLSSKLPRASQIATRIPDVFMVPFPSSAQNLLSVFETFNLNIAGLSLPLSCIGLGKYWERMFFTLVFPLIIAAGITCSSLAYAVYKAQVKGRGGMKNAVAAAVPSAWRGAIGLVQESTVQAVEDDQKSVLRVGGLIALPHLLMLSFLIFPMVSSAAHSHSFRTLLFSAWSPPPNIHQVSSAAFQAFACDAFDNGKSFLRADFAVECHTPEHDSVLRLAILGILLYPCGISLLYVILFFKAKRAILDEKPTALTRALGFLTLDFEKAWFAWELFEAWKKCMATSRTSAPAHLTQPQPHPNPNP